ncbi:MAG: isoaspartyl peptidase/L-asparaginase [Clostridia bacterium]|nr:isoaspartyl peptidase/L-asparaginase [Clostridia bacterium]
MFSLISTWKMSLAGMEDAVRVRAAGGSIDDALIAAITATEDNPAFSSVGYGGLPAKDGHVYLDSGFMDGDTLRCGCVVSAENLKNPILAAQLLCGRTYNCVLAGHGAENFAVSAGLPLRDMRTASSTEEWKKRIAVEKETAVLDAYREHDTVCVLGLDEKGRMISGTSTSGLFMKEPGRVGDSPIIGSGFYCDSRYGAAAATGVGEDIMRGCLSYEIVSRMKHGASAVEAAESALKEFSDHKLVLDGDRGSISVIALAPDGSFGAATTLPVFPFVVAGENGAQLYAVRNENEKSVILPVTLEEIKNEP